ncbi:MAG TPA: energy transducer TonB [Capillibacterium sp.]
MFLKALLISILIHLLVLSWDGAGFSFFFRRTREIPLREQHLDYRLVTLVELPPSPAVNGKGPEVPPKTKVDLESPRQTTATGFKTKGKERAPLASPAPRSPALAGHGPAPAEKMGVSVQQGQAAATGQGLTLDGQKQSSNDPFLQAVEAENGTGGEGETGAYDATALKTEVDPSAERGSDWANGVSPGSASSFANGVDGKLGHGGKDAFPAEGEDGAGPAAPVKVYHTDPVYPLLARRRGWEGTVYLVLLLDPEGTVLTVELTKSSGYAVLDEAAMEAVKQWRYTWQEGQTAAAEDRKVSVKITFCLTE